MPVPTPRLGSYQYVPETKVRPSNVWADECRDWCGSAKENLDWAELVTIDLAKFGTPEGKRDLADVLVKSVRETGFFYVKNFNIDQELVNRQFALGRDFYELPLEEKQKYIPEGLGSSLSFSKLYLRILIPCGRRRSFQRLHPCWTLYVRWTISSWTRLIYLSVDETTGMRDRLEIYNIPSTWIWALWLGVTRC
jgi:hypothetical protein